MHSCVESTSYQLKQNMQPNTLITTGPRTVISPAHTWRCANSCKGAVSKHDASICFNCATQCQVGPNACICVRVLLQISIGKDITDMELTWYELQVAGITCLKSLNSLLHPLDAVGSRCRSLAGIAKGCKSYAVSLHVR